jgi:hypothetical protein
VDEGDQEFINAGAPENNDPFGRRDAGASGEMGQLDGRVEPAEFFR